MNSLNTKIKAIRLLILDVDGILTDGSLYYGGTGIDLKKFNVHDGLGIKLLMSSGVEVAIISAKSSPIVEMRLRDLGVKHIYLGHNHKLEPYYELKNQLGLLDEQIAYMGDDLPDVPVLRQVGLALSVPDSPILNLHPFDYISKKSAGSGAVREVCEMIMDVQETLENMIQSYIQNISETP